MQHLARRLRKAEAFAEKEEAQLRGDGDRPRLLERAKLRSFKLCKLLIQAWEAPECR